MALSIRKLTHDTLGNIDIVVNHANYNIRITSSISNNTYLARALLNNFCDVFDRVSNVPNYRNKEVTARTYKAFNKVFILKNIANKQLVEDIISYKIGYYVFNIIITQFSVTLLNSNSTKYDVKRLLNTAPKKDIIRSINCFITEAFKSARHNEHNLFPDPAVVRTNVV